MAQRTEGQHIGKPVADGLRKRHCHRSAQPQKGKANEQMDLESMIREDLPAGKT